MGSQSSLAQKEQQPYIETNINPKPISPEEFYSESIETSGNDPNIVNTVFKWEGGGKKVQLTGSFTNWQRNYDLQNQGREHSIILRLPRGIHYYKFIVDGEWRFSPEQLTATDGSGNINNIIDTKQIKGIESPLHKKKTDITQNPQKEKRQDRNQLKSSEKQQQSQLQDFNKEAPPVPGHLLDIQFLNERDKRKYNLRQKTSNNRNQMQIEDLNKTEKQSVEFIDVLKNYFCSDNRLEEPTHVILNHVGSGKKADTNYDAQVITQRFGAKYTTYRYYSSNNKNFEI